MDDAPDGDKYGEEDQEATYAETDVVEFHATRSIKTLSDLYGEGKHQDRRQHIKERDDHGMTRPRKPQKNRVEDQDHGDAQSTNDDEVEHLVIETVLDGVVPGEKICVYA